MKDRQNIAPENIVAERSGWLKSSPIVTGIASLFFIAAAVVEILYADRFKMYFVMYLIVALMCIGMTVYFIICVLTIPPVIAHYGDDCIIFHVSGKKSVAVRREEILYIKQKNYHNSYMTLSTGKLTVETTNGAIVLRWVKNADDSRRKIEDFRNGMRVSVVAEQRLRDAASADENQAVKNDIKVDESKDTDNSNEDEGYFL